MRNKSKISTASINQNFWAPPALPFLEIRSTYDSLSPYAEHFHQDFSLGLILKGSTAFTCGSSEHLAEAGDLVLIEPNQVHSCNPVDGQSRSYHMLYIDSGWCSELCGLTSSTISWGLKRRILKNPDIYQKILKFVEAVQAGTSDRLSSLENIIREMLVDNLVSQPPAKNSEALEKARGILSGSPRRRRGLKNLAEALGLRRESLIRGFHRKQGLPPAAYQQCLRLQEGRRLLRRGAGIAEAALAAGFTDQSHFHRMFVKYFSATPRQYKINRSLSYKK